jgi:gluconolactonase
VQNAGAPAAGTGLQKSAITQKIALSQAGHAAATGNRNSTNIVDVVTVDANPPIINPNGASRRPSSYHLPVVSIV